VVAFAALATVPLGLRLTIVRLVALALVMSAVLLLENRSNRTG
jgi:hypothetical protein